ncbi:mevalonate kinase [Candidatus Nitrosotenuis sp. DW1]|uniref:mevalonate kinase n=1 Tax=Candidatus Nitrosotenuis sp. DW1 TaxID=2259672 RepID=UPI0015CCFABC|nr:mevalonate kinase [Candidatus Nitrosotenuis sp. DW1]QLH08372.1 mevalonate kinase [Candidatus Nitrosotenuis sp. DW1]
MKSTASAPAKIILFGEHFIVYGGKAILCSINKRITVESELTKTGQIEIESSLGKLKTSKSGAYKNADLVFRPIVYIAQRMLEKFHSESGIKIIVRAEFPSGVGLGSSSACCVAAAGSISGLFENNTKEEILKLSIDAERTIFENTSGADCTACVYGGILEYNKDGHVKKLEFVPKFDLVVANSGIIHSTSKVVSMVRQFKDERHEVFSSLCTQEASLIEEALNALQKNDLTKIGKLMTQNQEFLEKIGVSNDTLGSMISLVKDVSYGAKITGAGDGGCIIALADKTNLDRTLGALAKKYECFSAKIDMIGLEQSST